ncbi:unnamed protein product [Arctogadus glacialis]
MSRHMVQRAGGEYQRTEAPAAATGQLRSVGPTAAASRTARSTAARRNTAHATQTHRLRHPLHLTSLSTDDSNKLDLSEGVRGRVLI